jgi:SAM-dependent methyltransferase
MRRPAGVVGTSLRRLSSRSDEPTAVGASGMRETSSAPPHRAGTDAELVASNHLFYDALWSAARLVEAHRFNTWNLVRSLAVDAGRCLEVGPGLRLHLPLQGTTFVDISAPALARLNACGARVAQGTIHSLPFADGTFDVVAAFDILEHVDDDERALAELSRVAAPNGLLLLSTPLDPSRFTAFDHLVGHRRRYEPQRLLAMLAGNGLSVESSAAFGMQLRSSRWLAFGMWFLERRRARAMWWYNRVIMPLGIYLQKELAVRAGMIDSEEVDEIFLVCRRNGRGVAPRSPRRAVAGDGSASTAASGRRPSRQ